MMVKMPRKRELLSLFHRLFGRRGGQRTPGNVGQSRAVLTTCRDLMALNEAVLYDFFVEWDQHPAPNNPHGMALALAERGQSEGAWAFAHLYCDQVQKTEARARRRLHKGHPLCSLAILGQVFGSHAATRYYSQLSSAGDIYREHIEPDLRHGGLAPTILEQYESASEHTQWRDTVRSRLARITLSQPRYLESFVAARWFRETHAERIHRLGAIERGGGKPFVEVLLDNVEASSKRVSSTTRGVWFEAAAGLLLSGTPGFEVRSSRKTTDSQADLVVWYSPDRLTRLPIAAGPGLVECKSSRKPIGVDELRDFGAKCLFHRVGFGILIARTGITGKHPARFADPTHAELVRRRFQIDGLTLLVLDIRHLRGKTRELRGLQDDLVADHELLVFGPKAGDTLDATAKRSRGRRAREP